MKKAIKNSVVISGRTANVEVRSFSTGKSVARFSLALNRTEKKDGQETKHTCFIPFECWRNGAEAFKDLEKGQLITVEAFARPESYTDKNGKTQNHVVWVVNKYYATPDIPEEEAK